MDVTSVTAVKDAVVAPVLVDEVVLNGRLTVTGWVV